MNPRSCSVQVSPHVGVADLLGKNVEQGISFLIALASVRLVPRTVRDVGVLRFGWQNELIDIIEREPPAACASSGLLPAFFDQLGIHQFPDQRRGDQADLGSNDLLLHLPADILGRLQVVWSFPQRAFHDPLPIPIR